MSVLIETSFGDVVFDLFEREAPLACKNFLKLCKIKYYNNCEFFLVDRGFIIQTGDPTNSGKGGKSVYGICHGPQADFFEDEFSQKLIHNRRGLVSMASGGENTNGSQFFITTGSDLDSLDNKHTIFAEVAEGMEVVEAIDNAFTDPNKRPYQIIRIRHTIILYDPFEDPKGLPDPPDSPLPDLTDDPSRIGEDEAFDEEQDERTLEALEESRKRKEARSRAEVLEMIGDIKSADMKPPDNVLFVARLNPVTLGEDLEIIFSRFGECKAEVIRDRVTGDSLCYAFIEFDDKKSCEAAYFKMDNSLIDDRRIRVDFSQSVSKLWNDVRRGKREKISAEHHNSERHEKQQVAKRRLDREGRGMVFDTPMLASQAMGNETDRKRPRGGDMSAEQRDASSRRRTNENQDRHPRDHARPSRFDRRDEQRPGRDNGDHSRDRHRHSRYDSKGEVHDRRDKRDRSRDRRDRSQDRRDRSRDRRDRSRDKRDRSRDKRDRSRDRSPDRRWRSQSSWKGGGSYSRRSSDERKRGR